MKIKIKDKTGKIVREKEARNLLHFEVQKNTRAQVFESKKTYKRCRDKKVKYDY